MADEQEPRRVAGRFRLERRLGAGAFGEAHLAADEQTGRQVVLKVLLAKHASEPELVERFRREVRALEKLHHPNIPAAVASGDDDGQGRPWYAVEYCEGKDLLATSREDPFPWDYGRVLPLALDLLAALGVAHGLGIVHRDLKPANLLVTRDADGRERLKLIDFGIAKHLAGGANTVEDLTQGRVIGTPFYLAPEQAEGEPVDARTDLYAIGVILYEVLTGVRPIQGTTPTRILHAILNDPPPRLREQLPGAPPELERLLLQLMAKKRDERPASAEEVVERLRTIPIPDADMAATGIHAPPPAPAPKVEADPFVGKVLAQKYELKELLGKGGFGAVYRAHHRDLGMDVAIKLLIAPGGAPTGGSGGEAGQVPDRFRREARAMRSFVHKYAVQVRDFGRDGGVLYLEMDFLRGETLEHAIHAGGKLAEERTLALAGQVLSALAEAHRKGIVHRDLKPANVMLVREGEHEEARILDFGIVKLLGALEEEGAARTGQGVIIGTTQYMSPEQAGGDEVTTASDVYSLAVVLYEALAGQLPIDGGREPTQASLRARIMTKPPRPLGEVAPGVSERTCAAIMRALDKDPAKRPQDAAAFAEDLLAGTPHHLVVASQTLLTGMQGPPRPGSGSTAVESTAGVGRRAPDVPETRIDGPRPGGAGRLVGVLLGLALLAGVAVLALRPELRAQLLAHLGAGPAPNGPTDPKPTDPKPTDPTPTDPKPTDPKPTDPKPTDPKPTDPTPTDPTPTDPKPTDPKPTDPTPTDPTPTDPTPTDPKPTDPKPTDPKPTDPKPAGPAWWAELPESDRPQLPLPAGLAFGEEPRTYRNEADGSVLVFVPGGEALVGEPPVRVRVRPFFVGRDEVTAGQVARVLGTPAPADPNLPASSLSYDDAVAYCEKVGLRLPTEVEWVRAARLDRSDPFPWGTEDPATSRRKLANVSGARHGFTGAVPGGSCPEGTSPVGCRDLVGNVAEWVSDLAADGERRVVKGGSFRAVSDLCRVTAQMRLRPADRRDFVGLRVARSAR